MKKSPPHQDLEPKYSGPSRLFWCGFALLVLAGFYGLSQWAHPDVVFGTLILFGAGCAMGFPAWYAFRKGDSAWYLDALGAVLVVVICFALCFRLLFGPHPSIPASKTSKWGSGAVPAPLPPLLVF